MNNLHFHKIINPNSKTALVGTIIFDKNSWFNNAANRIIRNHLNFCEANGFNYFLFNKNILEYSDIEGSVNDKLRKMQVFQPDFPLPRIMSASLGLPRIYACAYMFEELGYDHVIHIDMDSMFLEPYKLDFDITTNDITYSDVYDFIVYAANSPVLWGINNGMTFEDITGIKYFTNGGIMHIRKGYIGKTDIDRYFDFFYKKFKNNFLQVPTDETYLGYLVQKHKLKISFFDQKEPNRIRYSRDNKYNVTNPKRFKEPGVRHIHYIGTFHNIAIDFPDVPEQYHIEPDL